MKRNLPVTQVEVHVPKNSYLVSITDLKGIITEANHTFVAVSGFSREELVGASHNIIRHPDMPRAAFADLWQTVERGIPWRGVIKNRCKNGDHYWVESMVVPLTKNEKVTGYMSVRSEASREAIMQAEAQYAKFQGPEKGPVTKLPAKGRAVPLSLRLGTIGLISIVALMVVVWSGLGALSNANERIQALRNEQLVPANLANRIVHLLGDSRAQAALAMQHEPSNPFVSAHDHPVSLHTDQTLRNDSEVIALVQDLGSRALSEDARPLIEQFSALNQRFIGEGLNPMRDAIAQDDFLRANRILLFTINPIYGELSKTADALVAELDRNATMSFEESQREYARSLRSALVIGGTTIVLIVLISVLTIRRIFAQMKSVRASLARIAEGDLTEHFSHFEDDEIGRIGVDVAITQTRLKVLLDHINQSVLNIEQQISTVRQEMKEVEEHSDAQHERVGSVAASTEEFSQSTAQVSESANETALAADRSKTLITRTTQAIDQSVAATGDVVSVVQGSSRSVHELKDVIGQIGVITQTIRAIAEQTNLLALNAAIEAARAGEQGRGFAVVADEVRTLSERTSQSTADIHAMVNTINAVTFTTVEAMDTAVSEVERGIGMMRESAAGLDAVVRASETVFQQAEHIATAAAQQATASSVVAQSMEEVSQLVEHNLSSASKASRACDELNDSATALRARVETFRIHDQGH